MKAYFLAVLAALSLFTAEAQANNDRTMGMSLSPIALLGARFNALYQYKLLDFLALTIPGKFSYNFGYAKVAEFLSEKSLGEQTLSPFEAAFGVGARILLNNKGLNDSFYVEPRVWLGYEQFGVKASGQQLEFKAMKFQPMFNFGWDWYWDYGLYMGLGFGIGYAIHFNQTVNIPDEMKALKENALVGFFFPITPGTLALDSEFKVGYSW